MDNVFITIGITYLVAIISPGPSASIILKNSLIYGRYYALLTSLGVVVGIAVQSGISLIGLSSLLSDNVLLFLKFAGALYLIILGIKVFLQKESCSEEFNFNEKLIKDKKNIICFKEGFVVEFLNPIAFTFFISLSTYIIDKNSIAYLIFWLELIILGGIWFFSFSLLSSIKILKSRTQKNKKILSVISGIIFIYMGGKSLWTSLLSFVVESNCIQIYGSLR
jgi:threonine/homoserine/homoserine lactone efflux protein